MKRKTCLNLLAILILSLFMTGCQSTPPHDLYPQNTATYTPETTPAVSEQVLIPDHIQLIFDEYKQVTTENDFDFEIISDSVMKKGDASYEFEFESDSSIPYSASFSIFNEQADKSFSVVFLKQHNTLAKEFITATFMVTGNLDYQTAKETMQGMVNSYRDDIYSDTIESGDYLVFLTPQTGLGGYSFHVKHKDEIIPEINKAEYSPVDYDTALAADMNEGMKVILKGEVLDNSFDNVFNFTSEKFNCTTFKDNDENVYLAFYDYWYIPVYFTVGQTYTFYGTIRKTTINDIPAIFISSFETENPNIN